jgi:hypothetical protein
MSEHTQDEARRLLQSLRAPLPDRGFRARLHRSLVAAGPPRAVGKWTRLRSWLERAQTVRLLWPAAGIACGAATFFALSAFRPPEPGSGTTAMTGHATAAEVTSPSPAAPVGDVAPSYAIPAARVAVVKLTFAAEVTVEDVTFEVSLPEGLVFWSRGERLAERSFRWPGRLEAGETQLPVAVRGERPGRYRVRARVLAAGHTLEHEVLLDVKEPA